MNLLLAWKPLAVALLIGFVAGCVVTNKWWQASEAAELQRSIEHGAEKAAGLEIQLELLQREARETNRRYANETRKDAYRCPLPSDGLRLLNEARTAAKPDR
ncbi:MAG: hypothetical protein K8U57_30530 [Planctomycetes bacterium]|nr:hypothetical protein [Planctomycetota bacterium]